MSLSCQPIRSAEDGQEKNQAAPTQVELTPKPTEEIPRRTSTNTASLIPPTVEPTATAALEQCPENSGKVVFAADIAEPGSGMLIDLDNGL